MGPVGEQEWYCFLEGRSSSQKSYFSLCFEVTNKRRGILIGSLIRKFFEVHLFHEMCHLTLFYVQWSRSVTAFGLFRLGNKSGGIYCISLLKCF